MPKKQKKPLYTRPSTNPHPSLSLSKSGTAAHRSTGLEDNRSVAECLKSLRNEDARRLPLRPPPVATVHPSLRNLLDVPEVPQPRARPGMPTNIPSRMRRIPRPAAPPSWQLLASRHAPQVAETELVGSLEDSDRRSMNEQVFLPGAKRPSRRSLLHTALKAMSERWDWHLQYDCSYLASLPQHLREMLLTYVTLYATDESLSGAGSTLRVLFPDEKEAETSSRAHQLFVEDASEVTRLDLSRALGTWLRNTSTLKKELMRPHRRVATRSPSLEVVPGSVHRGLIAPPESWDDADPARNENVTQGALPASLQEPPALKYSNLLHLSLNVSPSTAYPASVGSWSSLLSITSHLSTLQSLALGHWPCPTLTPHAAAVSATIRNPVARTLPRISYGGTDMYTESEANWREAAGILRRLSRHLYCLRWLDLTGCGSWFGALSWRDMEMLDDGSDTEARLPEVGPDWNGSWRNVEYLALGVGWTPSSLEDNEQSSIFADLTSGGQGSSSHSKRWLHSRLGPLDKVGAPLSTTNGRGLIKQDWDVEEERRKYFAKKEFERFSVTQARAREVARYLRALRQTTSGKWIEVDI
jgi:hypothetical protein